MSVQSSTGTTLESYLAWLKREADAKGWGEVGIHLTICNGQIVDVRKTSVDTEHFPLQRTNGRVLTEPRRGV